MPMPPAPGTGRRRAADDKRLSLADSCAWMKTVVDRTQTRFEDVRVDLRRREVGVAEHQLNGAQVGAALEQMRRERMPQHVRAQRARELRLAAVALQDLPESDAAHGAAARVHK